MGNVFVSDSVAYIRLECQFNYVFKPQFVHIMLLECQFNSKFKPQVCACYVARLLIQLGIQTQIGSDFLERAFYIMVMFLCQTLWCVPFVDCQVISTTYSNHGLLFRLSGMRVFSFV